MKSPGRVWILAEKLDSFEEESGNQQDSCTVSMKSLDSNRIAVKSLGRDLGTAGWL